VNVEPALVIGQAFAIVYGLVIGSFLAVCIVRLPEDRSLLVPSACPRCSARVRWSDNVPIVSWFLLRRQCRSCGAPIPPLYPLVELMGGLLGWVLFRRVFTEPEHLDAVHAAAWAVELVFLSMLVVAAATDIRHRIIPDETSIYAVPVGIAAHGLLQWLGWDGWLALDWRQAVVGAAIWGGFFAFVAWSTKFVTGRVALGWGDVKLAAMLGAFLGPYGAFLVVMFGSLIGAAVGIVATLVARRRVYLPYGPPLAVAATLYVLWGELLLQALFPGVRFS
jgi:leader peptidase (prepilin peptidase)/N-methyltransferase